MNPCEHSIANGRHVLWYPVSDHLNGAKYALTHLRYAASDAHVTHKAHRNHLSGLYLRAAAREASRR